MRQLDLIRAFAIAAVVFMALGHRGAIAAAPTTGASPPAPMPQSQMWMPWYGAGAGQTPQYPPVYGAPGYGFPAQGFGAPGGLGAAPGQGGPGADPFTQWAMSMMGPALSMANPYVYGQWMAMMMNPTIDQLTKHEMLEAMMAGFDPEMWFGKGEAGENGVPVRLPVLQIPGFPTQTKQDVRANTVTTGVSEQAKRRFYQTMMMMSPLSMRDMVGIMAQKMPVAEDVSFEDAVDSMKLRANEVNFKLVAHNPLWLDVRAITGDENTKRVEIFQFCDATVARKILDLVPEFVVFLPCRIALIEDADGKLWVMTLDWDVGWMDYAQNPNNALSEDLRADAKRIRDSIQYIMEGAATGDF